MQSERQADVLNFLKHGMEIASQRLTTSTLGDRTEYTGLSDLAKYSQCPRAALLSKTLPKDNRLQQMLVFARGHWMEDGIGQCLGSCGVPIMRQLEIHQDTDAFPVKAHLDFVLFTDTPQPKVRVVEVKSMGAIPDTPYPQHEFQASAQVTMLHDNWNKPVFSLRDDDGRVVFSDATFPQICKANFGVSFPDDPDCVSIEAWLLCVSMKDAVPFGPYEPTSEMTSELAILAEEFWGFYAQLREEPEAVVHLPYMNGYDPLCCVCQHNGDCPKFCDGDNQPQWEAAIEKWEMLKAQKTACEAELKELDAAIRQAYQISGTKDWITAGRYRFRVSQMAGRKSFNKSVLKDELTNLFTDRNIDMDVPAFLSNCEREGAPYTRLNISTINSVTAA